MYQQLPSPVSTIKQAFFLVGNRTHFLLYLLLGVIAAAAPLALTPLAQFIATRPRLDGLAFLIILFSLSVFALAANWFTAVLLTLNYHVASGQDKPLKDYLLTGLASLVKLFVTNLAYMAVVALGLFLLLVPGVLFLVWFFFAPTIVVVEGTGLSAFRQSRQLVTGRYFKVLIRLLTFYALFAIPNLLLNRINPLLGALWTVTGPFYSLLYMLLYLDLKRVNTPGQ